MTAPAWPADQVTRRPLADLIPYARNARTHSPAQVAKIAASIREFGWTMPALIAEDGTLIAGHGRLLAAQQLGLVDIPVMVAAGWSEAQRRAYVIADNKLSLDAGWDIPMLNLELEDLKLEGFDLNLTGFDADEILGLLGDDQDEDGANDEEYPKGNLSERFMIPPFSVLNAREGWWQDRKRAWLAIGIQSELGRGGGASTPPHPPTVTRNADGSLNYGGSKGQDKRFDRQIHVASTGDGKGRPIADSGT